MALKSHKGEIPVVGNSRSRYPLHAWKDSPFNPIYSPLQKAAYTTQSSKAPATEDSWKKLPTSKLYDRQPLNPGQHHSKHHFTQRNSPSQMTEQDYIAMRILEDSKFDRHLDCDRDLLFIVAAENVQEAMRITDESDAVEVFLNVLDRIYEGEISREEDLTTSQCLELKQFKSSIEHLLRSPLHRMDRAEVQVTEASEDDDDEDDDDSDFEDDEDASEVDDAYIGNSLSFDSAPDPDEPEEKPAFMHEEGEAGDEATLLTGNSPCRYQSRRNQQMPARSYPSTPHVNPSYLKTSPSSLAVNASGSTYEPPNKAAQNLDMVNLFLQTPSVRPRNMGKEAPKYASYRPRASHNQTRPTDDNTRKKPGAAKHAKSAADESPVAYDFVYLLNAIVRLRENNRKVADASAERRGYPFRDLWTAHTDGYLATAGENPGRVFGIIETKRMIRLTDRMSGYKVFIQEAGELWSQQYADKDNHEVLHTWKLAGGKKIHLRLLLSRNNYETYVSILEVPEEWAQYNRSDDLDAGGDGAMAYIRRWAISLENYERIDDDDEKDK